MSYQLRAGEPFYLPILDRTERIAINDDGYFYKTRECDIVGPFATESEALYDLNVFIDVLKIESELQFEEFLLAS